MGRLRLVGSLKLQDSFAEYSLFHRALLQKRPIILRSLLIVATPHENIIYHFQSIFFREHWVHPSCPIKKKYCFFLCRTILGHTKCYQIIMSFKVFSKYFQSIFFREHRVRLSCPTRSHCAFFRRIVLW